LKAWDGFLFAFHSNYGRIISEIFSVKQWPVLEIWDWRRSRSLQMALFVFDSLLVRHCN